MDLNNLINCLCREMKIESILCYGSYAQEQHDNKSDIDLLVLMQDKIPSSVERESIYKNIPDVKIVSIDKKHADMWDTSWVPVNDQLKINKQLIEVGYNTKSWVIIIIDKLINENLITFEEFPFRPYTFLGLLETSKILNDDNNFIKNCLSQIRPMPAILKTAIIQSFLPILKENYEDLVDCSDRNIGILAFQFYLFLALDALIGILFAINEVYDPASKRTEAFLFKLKRLPAGLSEFITNILPRFYEHKKETIQFFRECIKFIENNIN